MSLRCGEPARLAPEFPPWNSQPSAIVHAAVAIRLSLEKASNARIQIEFARMARGPAEDLKYFQAADTIST